MILAQQFIKKGQYEDKILMLSGGKLLDSVKRIPSKEDFRANMSKGGSL